MVSLSVLRFKRLKRFLSLRSPDVPPYADHAACFPHRIPVDVPEDRHGTPFRRRLPHDPHAVDAGDEPCLPVLAFGIGDGLDPLFDALGIGRIYQLVETGELHEPASPDGGP